MTTVDASDTLAVATADAGGSAGPFAVHRLRDLTTAGRVAAIVLGLLLLVAPVSSAIRQADRWMPQGDNGYIAMRAHDVGTSSTPLVGQPSTSHEYNGRDNIDHPGPFEFFLLAPLVRVVDDRTAMLVLAASISAVSLLTAAWGVFRRWGTAQTLMNSIGECKRV